MSIPLWLEADKITDIQYLSRGVDPLIGLDCYTLCVYLSLKYLGRVLPPVTSYINADNPEETKHTIREQVKRWTLVYNPELGDIILLKYHGFYCHCGFVLDDRHMVHTTKASGTTVSEYNEFPWDQKSGKIYRYSAD